jgi:hypothetical protein
MAKIVNAAISPNETPHAWALKCSVARSTARDSCGVSLVIFPKLPEKSIRLSFDGE